MSKTKKRLPPIHPGEILQKDFLEPMKITEYRLAKDIGVDQRRISLIVKGKRAITAATALLFSKYFGTTPRFWINLQSHYELEVESERLEKRLKTVSPSEYATASA